MIIDLGKGADWEVTDPKGRSMDDCPVAPRLACLLTEVFDGRPWRVVANGENLELIIQHETMHKHVDTSMTPENWNCLETLPAQFKDRIARPIMDALDDACFPSRQMRVRAAARQMTEAA